MHLKGSDPLKEIIHEILNHTPQTNDGYYKSMSRQERVGKGKLELRKLRDGEELLNPDLRTVPDDMTPEVELLLDTSPGNRDEHSENAPQPESYSGAQDGRPTRRCKIPGYLDAYDFTKE